MPIFIFQAKNIDGKFVKGQVDAADESGARVKIRAQKMIPIKVVIQGTEKTQPKGINFFNSKVSSKDLQIFTRQFAVLINAGVPVLQSLEALIQGTRSQALRHALENVVTDVKTGKLLAQSMSNQSHVFDRMYVNLVAAGEAGGVLDSVLNQLAKYIEKSAKIRNKILGALWYPVAIILVALAVITGILVFVIPQFVDLFESIGQDLPTLTRLVIRASELVQENWLMISIVLVGAPIGIQMYYKDPKGRKVIDSILLDLPVLGDLILKNSIARLTRTLATLLQSGVQIMESMEIAAHTSGNWVMENTVLKARNSVSKGKNLNEPLSQEKRIPSMVVQMISVGEQTGNLDTMLGKVADFYEDEVEQAAENLTSLIEPILMVVLGGIIAILVVAMYLPIFNIANVMS